MQWVRNGSRLGYRGCSCSGSEWVTPGLSSMFMQWVRNGSRQGYLGCSCSGYGMGHARVI